MSNLKEELNNYKDKKSSYKYIGLLIIVFVIAILIYMFFPKSDSQKVEYITSKVKTGDLMVVVSASGNIKPTNSVEIGIEVSGTIKEIFVDFNDEVKVGQVLAKIDTTKLEAQVESSRAALAIAKANQKESEVALKNKKLLYDRTKKMFDNSGGKYPSQNEFDDTKFAYESAIAVLEASKSKVAQASSNLKNDLQNLEKASVKSSIDGIVLNKEVEIGQTLAATMQAPKLFTLAKDVTNMDLVVSIDEADVADNKQFKTVLSYLYNVRIRLGLSGSIYMSKLKKDLIHNMNLRSFFGDEIHIITKQDMVKKGYSTPVIIKITEGNSHNPHLVADGWLDTFKKAVIEDPVAKKKSAERVLYNIKYNRLPAIIVTRFIEHAESLYKYYTNHPELKDYNIRVIDHTSKNRESIINQFAQGKIDVLITTYIIKRGINLPLAVYLQNAAGSDSEEDISQICGRMERTFKGKKKSYLDDMYYYGQYLERHSKHRINYYIRTGMKVINLKKKRNGKL